MGTAEGAATRWKEQEEALQKRIARAFLLGRPVYCDHADCRLAALAQSEEGTFLLQDRAVLCLRRSSF